MGSLRVAFRTLGCPKNEVDTEHMRALVTGPGLTLEDDPTRADVIVLNTCAFIEEAVEESVEEVLSLSGGDALLVVAGCLPSRYGADLESALPEADAFLPVAEEHELLGLLERLTGEPSASRAVVRPAESRLDRGPSAYLKVSEGCSRSCAYCTIPSIRGPYRSVPPERLVSEAASLVGLGAREIVLVGQDTSAYGDDLAEYTDLVDLARRLGDVEGLEWIRIMYVQPDGVTDPLLDLIESHPKLCAYLDVPLQHAAPDVLRAMGRRGDAERFLQLLQRIRSGVPGVSLRSTFIAGFPGESEDDLELLADFLREARFDHGGVFAYSPEEGTRAASLPGPLPADERRARARYLSAILEETGAMRASERVGEVVDVLVEGAEDGGDPDDDDGAVGRTEGQAPAVDGIVHLAQMLDAGTLAAVRIEGSAGFDLFGSVERVIRA